MSCPATGCLICVGEHSDPGGRAADLARPARRARRALATRRAARSRGLSGQPCAGSRVRRPGARAGFARSADRRAPPAALRAELQESARRWGVREGDAIVAYDDNGGLAAARAWWLLRWAGLVDVRLLDGGLSAWIGAEGALEAGDVVPEPGDVALRAGSLPTIDIDQAATFRGVLLDARAGSAIAARPNPWIRRPDTYPGR